MGVSSVRQVLTATISRYDPKMFRVTVAVVALVASMAMAYEHHGFISEVKHVPYKWYGGGGQGGFGGAIGGSQGAGFAEGGSMGMGMGGGSYQGMGGGSGYEDYHAYPKYKFEYGVKDYHTGDHKSQWEMRDGDVVKGEYTLDEADGTKRVVEYYADGKHGFEAKVKNIGHAGQHMISGGAGFGGQQEGGAYYGHGHSYSKLKQYN